MEPDQDNNFRMWSLIIAIIALIQPWMIAVWKRFFRQSVVELYPVGNLEIGFSNFGATLGFNGTLRSLHRDAFIRAVEAVVIRSSDGAKHTFNWLALRPPYIELGGTRNERLLVAAGFMVTTASPERVNIVMFDQASFQNVSKAIQPTVNRWKAWMMGTIDRAGTAPPLLYADEQTRLNARDTFMKDSVAVNAWTEIRDCCYWSKGDFEVTIKVLTSRPNKSFDYKYKFRISKEDADNLKGNTIGVLHSMLNADLGLGTAYFNFSYPSISPTT